jgi:hypothetical protein
MPGTPFVSTSPPHPFPDPQSPEEQIRLLPPPMVEHLTKIITFVEGAEGVEEAFEEVMRHIFTAADLLTSPPSIDDTVDLGARQA